MKHLLLTALLCGASMVTGQSAKTVGLELPAEVEAEIDQLAEDYGTSLTRAFLTLDDDEDGRVDMRMALTALMRRGFARPGGSAPEQYEEMGYAEMYRRRFADSDKEFIKLIKQDDAGMVGLEELVEGTRSALREHIVRQKPLDENKDGNLSLAEYAASYPIQPNDTVDAEGFTEHQRSEFARQDTNEDGIIQSHEWIAGNLEWVGNWLEGTKLTIVFSKLDLNGDRRVSKVELQKALPGFTELPETVAMRESRWWLRELPAEQKQILSEYLLPASEGLKPTFKWSPAAAAYYGDLAVVRYRAAMFGNTLVVEASHADTWKTYAIDNAKRSKEAFGENAQHENPTVINLPETVAPKDPWRQTRPKDYSKPGMNWFTWGFEGKAYFSIELESWPKEGFEIIVSAQVCDPKSCAMANNLVLTVPAENNAGASPAYRMIAVLASANERDIALNP
ncbi:MAG: hypothetical protein AAF212_13250 [Verrucomicrobiota bacterium]